MMFKTPYIVAEISANHLGSLERALQLVEAAAHAGADAVKTQCYTADSMTIDNGFLYQGKPLYELYRQAATPMEWHARIFALARRMGMQGFSSVFDRAGVDHLERIGCPMYKIASFEIGDLELIRYVAATGKPIIMSTGMADANDIEAAIEAARDKHQPSIALLHCVSGYPTPVHEANLPGIKHLRNLTFAPLPVGISDHTLSIEVPIAAVALGAVIIEKHLTLARADGGPDAAFSLEPAELKAMVTAIRNAWPALHRSEAKSEESSRALRRSLHAVADIRQGEHLTEDNVRSIRPAGGLPPKMLPQVLGSVATVDIPRGTPITGGLFL